MRKMIVALVGGLMLFGCQPDQPEITRPVAGTVIDGGLFLGEFAGHVESGKTARSWPLSATQLEQIYYWLQRHQSDWGTVLASPPPPSYSVVLMHLDGSQTQIDLYAANENWRHAVGIFRSDSEGRFLFRGQTILQSQDVLSLRSLLSEN
jgi:hypothetical protein